MKGNSSKFSVLMSVYEKERPEFLQQALLSIWDDQLLKPSEIVIVLDGPLPAPLEKVIQDFSNIAPVNTVNLSRNMGLGIALATGLDACAYDLVLRMDSDDIAFSDRFSRQVDFMQANPDIAFSSGYIAEFHESIEDISGIRKVPHTFERIKKFAKFRNPMNHMAIAFRKKDVIASGSYTDFPGYEDYYLWVRMIQKGYRAANIPETLMYARIGNNMYKRRQGIHFFQQEFKLQNTFYRINFIGTPAYVRNIIARAFPRLLPVFFLKSIYKVTRR